MTRAAVYVRVSTALQTGQNQVDDVRQPVLAREFEPVLYEESSRPKLSLTAASNNLEVASRPLGGATAPAFVAVICPLVEVSALISRALVQAPLLPGRAKLSPAATNAA